MSSTSHRASIQVKSPTAGPTDLWGEFLHHYATPGVTPPSARADPKARIQPRRPLRIWEAWKYGLAVLFKATEVTRDVLYHHIWGPRKKSWGIEMTIISSIMRGAGRHSSLVDIATIRMFMSIGGLLPLPSDALVTPVTFRVKKRRLRGLLAPFDALESGSRELSGEWVVGRKTWQRLQAEWKAARNHRHSSSDPRPKSGRKTTERVILYIHGGAYYLSSAAAQRLVSIPLSKYTDARVFAIDYRLAPETRFPGSLHDVVSGYLRLVEDLHIPPENIILAGDSAGGGLCLALLMYLRDNDYPTPAAGILMSPWVDLTMSCESWDSNAPFDVIQFPAQNDHLNPIALYLGEHIEEYLTHPYASPLFGDFRGLPPLLIQVGDAEVLRDEITLLAHKATLAGVEVRHELFEDAVHVFHAFPFLRCAYRAFLSMKDFMDNTPPQVRSLAPKPLDLHAELKLEQEIETEYATVIDGNGLETKASVHDGWGVEDLKGSNKRKQDGDVMISKGRSRGWSLITLSSLNEVGADKRTVAGVERPPQTRTAASRPVQELRRIQSTVSGFRTLQRVDPSPIYLSMSQVSTPPPSPSLRRSTLSHPDIASLVENWSHSGPANQTVLFKTNSESE